MSELQAHLLAERYPLLDGAEYDALKADIAANGLRNEIWLLDGLILDGRNRYRACRETGVQPRFAEYAGDDPAGFVDSQNLHRRHLTMEQRNERWVQLRRQGMTYRKIAEAEGVHHTTVFKAIQDEVLNCSTPDPTPQEMPDEAPEAEPKSDQKHGRAPDGSAGASAGHPPAATAGRRAPSDDRPIHPSPAKVTGRDGKQYAATKPLKPVTAPPKTTAEPSPEAKAYGVKGIGVFKANEAIDCLSRIPKDDPFRKRAKEIVLDWIKHNL